MMLQELKTGLSQEPQITKKEPESPAHNPKSPSDPVTPTEPKFNTPQKQNQSQNSESELPLDLSQNETGGETSKGVTLFPGLTITPGGGEEAPLTPSPTPSPPENTFPRFHFSRSGPPSGDSDRGGGPDSGGRTDTAWWYPSLIPGLPDVSIPFPGLPAFCK